MVCSDVNVKPLIVSIFSIFNSQNAKTWVKKNESNRGAMQSRLDYRLQGNKRNSGMFLSEPDYR